MAPRTERDHQSQDRSARHSVMDCDRALPSSGGAADPAAIAIPLQDRLAQTAKVRLILPPKCVTNRAQTPGQDAGASARTVERALGHFPHFFSSLRLGLNGSPEPRSQPTRETHPLQSFTFLTTQPMELICTLHNYMPVVFHERDYDERMYAMSGSAAGLSAPALPTAEIQA